MRYVSKRFHFHIFHLVGAGLEASHQREDADQLHRADSTFDARAATYLSISSPAFV
jgi:hypothetical protein